MDDSVDSQRQIAALKAEVARLEREIHKMAEYSGAQTLRFVKLNAENAALEACVTELLAANTAGVEQVKQWMHVFVVFRQDLRNVLFSVWPNNPGVGDNEIIGAVERCVAEVTHLTDALAKAREALEKAPLRMLAEDAWDFLYRYEAWRRDHQRAAVATTPAEPKGEWPCVNQAG